MRDAILVMDGKPCFRRFWSRWMSRALAQHESEMAMPRLAVAANDIELEDDEAEIMPTSVP
jgi:hypothetical protein